MKTLLKRLFPFLFKREIVHASPKLPSNIKIFIPNLDKDGKHLPASKIENWIRYFSIRFAQTFGGCSIHKVQGYYMAEHSQQIMIEETAEIRVTCFDNIDEMAVERLISEFKEFGIDCLQEQVLYEIDNQSYLIEI